MHKILTIVAFLLLGLLAPREASAQLVPHGFPSAFSGGGGLTQTSYYVNNSGSDSSPGTVGSPWQTLTKVNGFTFPTNSTIFFAGGQSFSGTLEIGTGFVTGAQFSGTLTVDSYGTGRATINAGTGDGFYIINVGNVTIQDLIFTASGGANNLGGYVTNSQAGNTQLSNVLLNNLDVSGFDKAQIVLGGDAGTSGFTNFSLTNSVLHGAGNSGFQSYGSVSGSYSHYNVTLTNVTTYDIPGHSGVGSGSGIVLGEVDGATVQNSLSYGNGTIGLGGVGIWTYDSNNIHFVENESHHNTSTSGDGDGFDFDGGITNSLMEKNYSHDNKGSGFLLYAYAGLPWSSNTLRDNISQNDGSGGASGIYIGNDGTAVQTGASIYNNTVYNSSGRECLAIGVGTSSNNITALIANNIFNCDSTPLVATAATLTGSSVSLLTNDYYAPTSFSITWLGATYTSFASWQTATGQEKISGTNVGLTSNPLLSGAGSGGTCGGWSATCPSQYELTSGSPMIGTGLNLTLSPYSLVVGTSDYYTNTIPNGTGTGYNVGAYGAP